jgi:hypothetical protein
MLLALSPKGLLTYKRMVIRALGWCLPIGLCTIALIVGRMGIKRAFATVGQRECGETVLLGLCLFIALLMGGMNTCAPKKAQFVDGFYDTLSSELGHARGHAPSDSCVGS